MVVVPAGAFTMGSPESEEVEFLFLTSNERPQHSVAIPAPFAVGVYEVTLAEWDSWVRTGGSDDSTRRDDMREYLGVEGQHPAFGMSWDDAQAYVSWLSERTGARYRPLSEAEWEYVARAGTQTARYWGESDSDQCRYANGYDLTAYRAMDPDDREGRVAPQCSDGFEDIAPVGSFAPNAFGLYDVLGNVPEWTRDCAPNITPSRYGDAPTDGPPGRRGTAAGAFTAAVATTLARTTCRPRTVRAQAACNSSAASVSALPGRSIDSRFRGLAELYASQIRGRRANGGIGCPGGPKDRRRTESCRPSCGWTASPCRQGRTCGTTIPPTRCPRWDRILELHAAHDVVTSLQNPPCLRTGSAALVPQPRGFRPPPRSERPGGQFDKSFPALPEAQVRFGPHEPAAEGALRTGRLEDGSDGASVLPASRPGATQEGP